ncbi:MAG: LysM peptidoglycan-binding domain-containing protein [Halioglobus sp.]
MWFLTACQSLPDAELAESVSADSLFELSATPSPRAALSSAMETAATGSLATVAPARSHEQAARAVETDLWQRVRAGLTWQSQENQQIARERQWYLSQSGFLPLISQRAQYYLHYIVEEVEKRDLPMELALLPVVESNLNPFADSPSHASGLWQIMPRTGRHLGLRQDYWYDGRRDLRDSTRAGLDYLEELYAQCEQDWLLTLAAYNAGKARVLRAQRHNARRGESTDYWSLRLPRETRRYVPRLIALAQIVADPAEHDARLPPLANSAPFEIATAGGQLEIVRAAELADVDIATFRALNPGQLRWATSPDKGDTLLVPLGKRAAFEQGIAQLDSQDRVRWQHYRIARGDSLIRIANKFNTEVALLREVNGIRGSRIRAGDTLLIPQGDAWESSLAYARPAAVKPQGYRVRRGDSLYRIAGKFNVSINDIIAWNALDPRKYLQPGQKLTLYVGDG